MAEQGRMEQLSEQPCFAGLQLDAKLGFVHSVQWLKIFEHVIR